ncbi:MAG: geranylgeranyl reductase family protein [Candidatus Thorarchaeota archaeon]|nr:geranylgeranyl reductase family protein [Candidatus Thorarchaeota archaeon]
MKDVIVIGGGPAGSATAFHASRLGMDVVLLDKAKFPRFKSCGGALSHKALPLIGPKAKKAINTQGKGLVVYSPKLKSVRWESPQSVNLVVRTKWDHQFLLDAADAGTEVHEESMVTTVESRGDHVTVESRNGLSFDARYVVIADGAGLRSYKKKLGFTQPYDHMARTVCCEVPMDDDLIDVYLGSGREIHIFFGVVPRGYGWVFPKRGYLNVGIGFGNEAHPDRNQFEIFDDFVKTLKERKIIPESFDGTTRKPAAIPFKKPFTPIGRDNILLAGDAGGFVSPVTGEGIYYGIVSGQQAAETFHDDMDGNLEQDIVSSYTQRWMEIFGDDMINHGLPLANMIYKSLRRMELVVRLMGADEQTRDAASRMILGLETYKAATSKIFRRAPLSVLKSLRG